MSGKEWASTAAQPAYGMLPFLLSSLYGALGVGRAIGEAMAVMMMAGSAPNMPSLFGSVRFLTTAVSSGMAYARDGSLRQQALFSVALVLLADSWGADILPQPA